MASEAGKGSKPRPIFNQKQFDDNFDLIFSKKEKKFDEIVNNGELLDELKESSKDE